ncbi:BBE domain-containing protein [Anatilimnocola sp. NA78]
MQASSCSLFAPNYDRLLALKNQFDQTKSFLGNANIAPSQS